MPIDVVVLGVATAKVSHGGAPVEPIHVKIRLVIHMGAPNDGADDALENHAPGAR